MYCYNCGKEMDNNQQRCPYCGAVQHNSYNGQNPEMNNGQNQGMNPQWGTFNENRTKRDNYDNMCIVSIIMACISFFTGFGLILAIPALIISIKGYNRTKYNGKDGRALALTGIILSAIVIFRAVLALIIFAATDFAVDITDMF